MRKREKKKLQPNREYILQNYDDHFFATVFIFSKIIFFK